jgi:SsrA-binding protein
MSAPIATNKKAYHNFFLTDKWECGIALNGAEVKSIRAGEVNFKDSYARFEKEEIFLYNLHINPYLQAGAMNGEPDRPRKLLLHKREIKRIKAQAEEKHLALIPTKIYFNARGYVKVEIALGQGKKLYDKRETMKKRSIDQALKRTLKSRRR